LVQVKSTLNLRKIVQKISRKDWLISLLFPPWIMFKIIKISGAKVQNEQMRKEKSHEE